MGLWGCGACQSHHPRSFGSVSTTACSHNQDASNAATNADVQWNTISEVIQSPHDEFPTTQCMSVTLYIYIHICMYVYIYVHILV